MMFWDATLCSLVHTYQLFRRTWCLYFHFSFNNLNAELNPTCHLLALLGAHHILHVSKIRVITKQRIFRLALTAFCLMIILL